MTYYSSYHFNNGKTYVVDRLGNTCELCQEVKITSIIKSLDNPEEPLKIRVSITDNQGKPQEYVLDRHRIVEAPTVELSKYGLSVAKVREYDVTLTEVLFETEMTANVEYNHEALGFRRFNNKLIFFGKEALTKHLVSNYSRKEKLSSRGSFEEWREGLVPFLKRKQELILALAMGVSAPVVALLNIAGEIDETPIWALIGLSSTGKSTAIKCSASAWGVPSLHGAIDSFLGTENGLYSALANKNGFPHYLDESSAQSWDFSRAIYKISLSSEGVKSNPDGSPKIPREWMTSVTLTGEKSILTQTNGNGGLFARIVEFNLTWTEEGSFSDDLLRHINKNHGTASKVLIETLKRLGKKDLVQSYHRCIQELKEKFKSKSGVYERITKKLAILLLSVEIAGFAWNLPVDRKKILEMLSKTYEENSPRIDKIDNAYEALLSYIANNKKLFPKKGEGIEYFSSSGVIETMDNRPCVWIDDSVFSELLNENGISATDNVLHIMKDRHMIKYFTDRFRKKHSVSGIDIKCVCVFLDTDTNNQVEQKKSTSSRVKRGERPKLIVSPEIQADIDKINSN